METRYGTPIAGSEKEVLGGFLDHYRQVIIDVCEGLSEEDLRKPMTPSGTSLLGMVKHLAYVEQGWFLENIADEQVVYPFDIEDSEADFRIEEGETSKEILDLYRASCERSRQVLAGTSLDALIKNSVPRPWSRDYNVRWIVVHMIEETARHAGHADILRELIDGKTETGYV